METNQFLRRVDFDIRKVLHTKVARAWLDMGISMSSFRKNGADNPWREHMKIVIGQFQKDPPSYLARLSALVRVAVESGADVLLFPACTIVYKGKLNLPNVLGTVPRILMSGVVELSGAGNKETAILAHGGHITEQFDGKRVNVVRRGRILDNGRNLFNHQASLREKAGAHVDANGPLQTFARALARLRPPALFQPLPLSNPALRLQNC